MTWCLFQISSYKTRWWIAFFWVYVFVGAILAIPLALGQYAMEQIQRMRRSRWLDSAAL
jgi:cell division protein FtsW (lipid II flippase)